MGFLIMIQYNHTSTRYDEHLIKNAFHYRKTRQYVLENELLSTIPRSMNRKLHGVHE